MKTPFTVDEYLIDSIKKSAGFVVVVVVVDVFVGFFLCHSKACKCIDGEKTVALTIFRHRLKK